MRFFFLLHLFLLSLLQPYAPSFAGEWSTIDNHTLRFEGSVEISDISSFQEHVSDDIKTIILNCGGGNVLGAIPIAERIQRQHIDIIVDGICASSCANYFFIAANNKKVLEGSLVLFHGGITPLLEQEGKIAEEMTKAGATKAQIESQTKDLHEGAIKERAIYKKAGVDMSLLEYSHRTTNGKYNFWAPPLETLKQLGVRNVTEFWYPGSDVEINALANKLRSEFAKKYSKPPKHLKVLGGGIVQNYVEN